LRRFFQSIWVRIGLVLALVGGIAGVWALLHPAAFWLQPWRPERSEVAGRFIFGPYPVEPDFVALQKKGVTTIVSLLDSDLPYEKVLLGQEQERAARYGMRVLNFPMASILGQSFGKDYLANSKAAAQAALASQGVVYLHCYLGLHRAANVRKFLEEADAGARSTANYEGTLKSGRSPDTLALDRANIAFTAGDMREALRQLAVIEEPEPEAVLLAGWTHYGLHELDAARASFEKVLEKRPDSNDAAAGLGFCALAGGDLPAAGRQFSRLLKKNPDDPSGLEGLGHVRHRQGRDAEARELFGRLLASHENSEVRALYERISATPATPAPEKAP
jgi:tetratricopeptide (TPR) repeat protein